MKVHTPTQKEEFQILQKIGRYFEGKKKKVAYTWQEWKDIQVRILLPVLYMYIRLFLFWNFDGQPKAEKPVEIVSEQSRTEELTRRRATGDEITVSGLSKLASKKWRELSSEQKAMAEREKEQYGDGDDDRKSRRSVKNKKDDKGEKENVRKAPNIFSSRVNKIMY